MGPFIWFGLFSILLSWSFICAITIRNVALVVLAWLVGWVTVICTLLPHMPQF